jgi:hypothetical protein
MSELTINSLNKNKNNLKSKNRSRSCNEDSYAHDLDILNHKQERTAKFEYGSKKGTKHWKSIRQKYVNQANLSNLTDLFYDASIAQYMKSDYLLKLLEDIFILFHTLSKSNSKKDYLVSIGIFAKLRCHDSSITMKIYESITTIMFENTTDYLELQNSENIFKDLRFYLDSYTTIKNSLMYKKVYRCILYLLSLSFFDKVGITLDKLDYSRIEQEALRKKYHMGPDFIYTLLETSLFLVERGYQFVQTRELSSFFHCENSYGKFYDETLILKKQSALLNEPELHGFSEPDFLERLDSSIEQGQSMIKFSNKLSESDSRFLKSVVNDLELIKSNLMSKSRARDTRKTPFAVLIYGDSSIGKSSLTDMIFHHFGKFKGLPTDAKYKYVRNPVAKYWDGFKTSQWCTVIDDIAFLKPNASPSGDPSTLEVIQIINPTPFVPDQAALEDKGRIPFRGELVIATTNTENLNAYHYFSCPSAVQRRLPWIIDVVPKPEYKNDDGMLDSSLVNVDFGDYPDLWVYTIKKVKPTSARLPQRQNAKIEVVHENIDLRGFLLWLNKAITQHDQNQTKVQDSLQKMESVKLCEQCKLPPSVCVCNLQTQSEEKEEEISTTTYFLAYCLVFIYGVFVGFVSFISAWLSEYLFTLAYCFGVIFTDYILSYAIQTLYRLYKNFSCTRFLLDLAIGSGFIQRCIEHERMLCMRYLRSEVDRIRMTRIGLKIQRTIGYPKFFMILGGVLTTSLAAYKVYKLYSTTDDEEKHIDVDLSIKFEESYVPHGGISSSVGETPIPLNNQRENVWYKNDFQLTNFDVSERTTGYNGLTHEEICKIILRNCYSARLMCGNKCMMTKMFCIGGRIFLINKHALVSMDEHFELEMIAQSQKDGVSRNRRFPVCKSSFQCDDSDVALISLPLMDAHKDFIDLFASDTFQTTQNGYLLCRFENGEDDVQPFWRAHYFENFTCPTWPNKTAVWEGLTDKPTVKGMCGSIFICMSGLGPVILGMHFLGYDNRAVSISIRKSYLLKRLEAFEEPVIQSGVPALSSDSAKMVLGDLHKKSPIRYIGEGHANVYGSFLGFRTTPKSSVSLTPLNKELSNYGYETKYGPPVMTGWEPKRKALVEMVNTVEKMDAKIIRECSDSFYNDIISSLDPKELKQCMVYDNFTAVNGCAGVTYVDKMNRNTSAGNPWKKSKKFFMRNIPARGENLDPVEFSDEIMNRVDIIIEKYRSRERVYPNFCAHLKDEAVSFKKIRESKTRVFTGAPVDWSIVVRKFFLSSIRLLQSNRFIFEAAPGTIAQSLEWQQIHSYLVKHGEHKIVAGDYGNYDKAMMSTVILEAFRILIRVNKASGNFNSDDINVMYGIAEDTAFPLIDFFGDLISFHGSNPSGHPLTVIINSLVNSIYMRYVYVKLSPLKSCVLFKQHVNLMTYGDDNIMGVSDDAPWFNHTAIQTEFANVGIVYTMADKEAKSEPYIHISQASFLKRVWRYDPDIDALVCPLDHSSIEKMLMVWVKSKTISIQEQMCAIVASAVREYFWYGRKTFETKSRLLKESLVSIGYERWIEPSTFPDWSQLRDDFWRASAHLGV